jgi:hypothetical protein
MSLLHHNRVEKTQKKNKKQKQSQQIGEKKARRVIVDVVKSMFGEAFVKGLFVPQKVFSFSATRQVMRSPYNSYEICYHHYHYYYYHHHHHHTTWGSLYIIINYTELQVAIKSIIQPFQKHFLYHVFLFSSHTIFSVLYMHVFTDIRQGGTCICDEIEQAIDG